VKLELKSKRERWFRGFEPIGESSVYDSVGLGFPFFYPFMGDYLEK